MKTNSSVQQMIQNIIASAQPDPVPVEEIAVKISVITEVLERMTMLICAGERVTYLQFDGHRPNVFSVKPEDNGYQLLHQDSVIALFANRDNAIRGLNVVNKALLAYLDGAQSKARNAVQVIGDELTVTPAGKISSFAAHTALRDFAMIVPGALIGAFAAWGGWHLASRLFG